jgi:hypothetical protein
MEEAGNEEKRLCGVLYALVTCGAPRLLMLIYHSRPENVSDFGASDI